MILRAGYIQFKPEFLNLDKTLKSLEVLLNESLLQRPNLLVLPELANSGYNFSSLDEAKGSEALSKSVYLQFLRDFVLKNQVEIVTGFNEKDYSKLYNSAVFINYKGEFSVYRKIHLFNKEKEFFTPGDKAPEVYQGRFYKLGMLVCFDWMFPEVWRILGAKGADIICHPSNLVLPGFAQKASPVHALVNHTYVITANRVGEEQELTFTGMSTIASPIGEVLSQADPSSESIAIVDMKLDLARNKQITAGNHIFNDRRPDLYSELITKGN